MKKFITVMLALALVASLSVTAFAADVTTTAVRALPRSALALTPPILSPFPQP